MFRLYVQSPWAPRSFFFPVVIFSTKRETDRQRQTDRQTDRQAGRQAGTQTEREQKEEKIYVSELPRKKLIRND